jgi:hypothetical protein
MTKYLVMLSLCISVSGCMTTPALPDDRASTTLGTVDPTCA